MCSFLGGTPGASLMLIRPGVKIKPVERDAGSSHGNFDEVRPDVAVEDRRTDAEVGSCLRRPQQPREEDREHGITSTKS